MRIYKILDEELNILIGTLLYYEKNDTFIIELMDDLTEWDAPLLFASLVKKGIFTIQRKESSLWVKERIIPSGRQNINDILDTHHLKKYDEIKFLEISKARCSQDSMYLKKVDILPEYVQTRQLKNLLDVTPLNGYRLLCIFNDKKIKIISLHELEDIADITKVLQNDSLFNSCSVSPGGYAATFNDSIDIPAAMLYEKGSTLLFNLDDLKTLVEKNVLSTAESCSLLECSRQNIAYMVAQEHLKPLKKDDTGSLYLKGELIRTKT